MSNTPSEAPIVVVMGVSGSGKSTIGELVAEALSVPFIDADSLHPLANVEKMAAGQPLTDEDRWPWLAKVGQVLAAADATGAVVACSALKRVYRDAIRSEAPRALFLHLSGSKELLASRLGRRSGHFMPATLLDSQLQTLEPLAADESGVVVDVAPDVMTIVSDAVAGVRERLAASAAES
jgi:carbohydrate kinase (thermoresistant glucokinase family)